MKNKEFIAYGIHPISEAVKEGKPIEKVLVQKGLKGDSAHDLVNTLRKVEVPIQYVPKAKLDRITGKNHQGMIAFISPIEYQNIEWLLPDLYEKGETPLILVLDGITDVRNFGAICRTAEGAGVHAVIIPVKGSAQIGPDAIKTSAGALLQLPVCRTMNLTETLKFLKTSGLGIFACHEKAEDTYTEADLTAPAAIVMGSEESGINIENLATSTEQIRIPLQGQTSSLNVSTAAGIILFETLRQRSAS